MSYYSIFFADICYKIKNLIKYVFNSTHKKDADNY